MTNYTLNNEQVWELAKELSDELATDRITTGNLILVYLADNSSYSYEH